ncbi:MAG TPA: HAD family hydrolase, partial [Candidatus Babeliales bacterium]|nr:HAD family hydrolase [Candidatus Babeliales bacterium]
TVLKLLWSGGVVEQAILTIPQRYPSLAGVVPLALQIVNHQAPRPEMVQLLQDLHQAGYTLLILSNIGTQSLAVLQQRHPTLFRLFQGVIGASASDGYQHKPQAAVWAKFYAQFGGLKPHYLLIDDKSANLQAAAAAGFLTWRFTGVANLRARLLTSQ